MTGQIIMAYSYSELDPAVASMVQSATVDIQAKMRRAAQDIVDIGARLLEVKAALPHGHFGEWLRAEFQWDERQARRFMNVAERFKTDNLSDLQIAPSALYALAAPSTPDEAREEAVQVAEQGQRVGTREAKEIIARHKEPAVEPAFWQPDQNQRDRAARIGYQYNVEVRPATTAESEMWIAYENGVIIATIAATTLDGIYRKLKDRAQVAERAAIAQAEQAQAAPAQRKEVPPDAREIDDLTMRFERLGWRFRLFVDRTTAQRSFLVEPDTTVGWTQMQKLTSIEDAWELLGKLEREAQEQPAGEPQPAPAKWKPTPDQMQRIKRMNAQYGVEISYDPYQLWHARRGKMIIGNYCFAPDLDELESKLQSKTASTDPLAPVNDPAQGLVAEIRYWRDTSKRHEQERDEVQKHNWSLFQQNRRLMEQKLELIRKLKRLERGQR
jgi:hypothetical protein